MSQHYKPYLARYTKSELIYFEDDHQPLGLVDNWFEKFQGIGGKFS